MDTSLEDSLAVAARIENLTLDLGAACADLKRLNAAAFIDMSHSLSIYLDYYDNMARRYCKWAIRIRILGDLDHKDTGVEMMQKELSTHIGKIDVIHNAISRLGLDQSMLAQYQDYATTLSNALFQMYTTMTRFYYPKAI